MTRQNTELESEGAEFLVLGHLLYDRIPSYKAYTNMPGYDLVATSLEHNTSAHPSQKPVADRGSGVHHQELRLRFRGSCQIESRQQEGNG